MQSHWPPICLWDENSATHWHWPWSWSQLSQGLGMDPAFLVKFNLVSLSKLQESPFQHSDTLICYIFSFFFKFENLELRGGKITIKWACVSVQGCVCGGVALRWTVTALQWAIHHGIKSLLTSSPVSALSPISSLAELLWTSTASQKHRTRAGSWPSSSAPRRLRSLAKDTVRGETSRGHRDRCQCTGAWRIPETLDPIISTALQHTLCSVLDIDKCIIILTRLEPSEAARHQEVKQFCVSILFTMMTSSWDGWVGWKGRGDTGHHKNSGYPISFLSAIPRVLLIPPPCCFISNSVPKHSFLAGVQDLSPGPFKTDSLISRRGGWAGVGRWGLQR